MNHKNINYSENKRFSGEIWEIVLGVNIFKKYNLLKSLKVVASFFSYVRTGHKTCFTD